MLTRQDLQAHVVALYRYPVKSMQGEELDSSAVSKLGLFGDRVYALVDKSEGHAGTARNSRKWPNLFEFSAALINNDGYFDGIPPVRISFPDGTILTNEMAECNVALSAAMRREVTLESISNRQGTLIADGEDRLHDPDNLAGSISPSGFTLPEGNFFDAAVVHLLTTASLARLAALYPAGRLEPRRFRPNILINTGDEQSGFVENDWIGRKITIGDEVHLGITRPCGRCVMTTLPQGGLPADPGILKTIAKYNNAKFGVYAEVLRGGTIRRGDSIRIE